MRKEDLEKIHNIVDYAILNYDTKKLKELINIFTTQYNISLDIELIKKDMEK